MIGIFDSGLGGLSVLNAIAQALPQADICYVGDTANLPYGEKSNAFICERVLSIGQYLFDKGCSQIVVACNTATAAAITALREQLPNTPIIGVEPGIKPAAAASKSGRITVLITTSTAQSTRLANLIDQHALSVIVDILPCPGWATRVETLELHDALFAKEVRQHLKATLEAGSDQLVLGCTHYTFLVPLLTDIIPQHVNIVDVAKAVARQCSRLCKTPDSKVGRLELLATATPERLEKALTAFNLSVLTKKTSRPAMLIKL